jgi:hypothetical protein
VRHGPGPGHGHPARWAQQGTPLEMMRGSETAAAAPPSHSAGVATWERKSHGCHNLACDYHVWLQTPRFGRPWSSPATDAIYDVERLKDSKPATVEKELE